MKYTGALKRSKLQLRWKRCGKMCDGDQSQKVLNGSGKKGCSIVCFTIGMPRLSMQQCLEIWLTVLSDLSCKLDVLSSALTLTDIMKPLSKVEPGRDDTS